MILLVPKGNGFEFEDANTGVTIERADAIRLGFYVTPPESGAAVLMMEAALSKAPTDTLYASAWEQIAAKGAR